MALNPTRHGVGIALTVIGALLANPGSGLAQAGEERSGQGSALELRVRVAVAPDLARQRGWFSEFQCATSRASQVLEEALGRQLSVRDRVPWPEFSGDDDLYALRRQLLRGVDHDGADLVVGLVPTGTRPGDAGGRIVEDGLAAYSQGYVVLRVGPELCEAGQLLAHEIAHVFGGIHRRGAGNLMDPLAPGSTVDELNAALFDLHRDRMIRQEDPPLRGDMLRMMWRLAGADTAAADTWLKVGVLAATMNDLERASAHYERALGIDPQLQVAWANLGHVRLQAGAFADAERAYLQALAIDADDGVVHNNLAVVYMSVGQPERAAASMNRALELDFPVPDEFRAAVRKAIGGGGPPAR